MKRITIFCDGTWNKLSAEFPTNVARAFPLVLHRGVDDVRQITFYDEGVGSSFVINEWLETRLAGAFGLGLFEKIEAAYRFLVCNYEPGDEIFIFGFSRGAYIARSLAGMIRKCGIIPKSEAGNIKAVFDFYKDAAVKPDSDKAQEFRLKYSPGTVVKNADRGWRILHGADVDVTNKLPILCIKYIGVWDTVGALGVPQHLIVSQLAKTAEKYAFHDADLSSTIWSARHAVAIDENRRSFEPALWTNLGILNEGLPEPRYEELWFPGGHGSVGGGGDIVGLSHASLVWVMEGAARQGLTLDEFQLDCYRDQIDATAPLENVSKPAGWIEKIYRRSPRVGPQNLAALSEIALKRLESVPKLIMPLRCAE